MKLRTKLYLLILITILVIVAILAIDNHNNIVANNERLIESKLLAVSRSKTYSIDHYFKTLEDELGLVSSRSLLLAHLEDYLATGDRGVLAEIRESLSHAVGASHLLDQITLTDPEGNVLVSTMDAGESLSPDLIGLEEPEVILGFVEADGRVFVHSRVPIYDEGETLDALMYVLSDFTDLTSSITDVGRIGFDTDDTQFAWFQENGEALYLTPMRYDPDSALSRTVSTAETSVSVIQALEYPDGGFIEALDYRGTPVFAYVSYLEEYDMGLSVELDVSEIQRMVTSDTVRSFFLFILILVGVSIVVIVALNRLFAPLKTLAAAMSQASEDEYHEVTVSGKDEIGLLARTYNEMQRRQQTYIAAVEAGQDRYQSIMQLATDAIFLIRPEDGRMVECNARTKELLGYDDSDGMESLTVMDWDRGIKDLAMFHGIIDGIGDEPVFFERVHTRKDGSSYIAAVAAARIMLDGTEYIYSSARDITSQKAQEALIQSQNENLEIAQRTAKLGFWEYAIPEDRLTWSDEIYHIFGIPPKSFSETFESFLSFVHREDRDRVAGTYTGSLEQKSAGYHLQHRVVQADGTVVYVNEIVETEYDGEGNPLRSFGTVQDITQLAAYEREISEKNALLEETQHIARLGFWDADMVKGTVTCSSEIYTILGTDPESFDGSLSSFGKYIHPDDVQRFHTLHVESIAKRKGYQFTYRVVRDDWTAVDVQVQVRFEFDEDGKPVRSLGVMQDITEQVANENRLLTITNTSPDAIIMMDPEGLVAFWNPAAQQMFGYTAEEVLGKHLHNLLAPERFHAAHNAAYPEFLKTGKGGAIGKTVELQALRKDGSEIDIALSLGAVQRNNQWHAVAVARDITEQKRAEALIKSQKEELETIFQTSLEGISLLTTDRRMTFVNKRFAEIFGYEQEEMLSKTCHDLTDPDYYEELERVFAQVIETGSYEGFERYCYTKEGIRKRIKSSIAMMPDREHVLMTSEDITELYDAMELIKKQAITDELTQLWNRKAYNTRLGNAVARYQRYHVVFSLLLFDIDHFKFINDSYGHLIGDKVLVNVSHIVSSLLRKNDYFFRLGGDEFVLILSNTNLEGAAVFADRVRTAIQQKVIIVQDRTITVSMGVAEVGEDDDPDTLFKRTDDNLYKAKGSGRNCVVAG